MPCDYTGIRYVMAQRKPRKGGSDMLTDMASGKVVGSFSFLWRTLLISPTLQQ